MDNFLSKFKILLSEKKKIVLISHVNPDGDAVGSILGLGFFLMNKGHEVVSVLPNDFPDFLAWLPGADTILLNSKNPHRVKNDINEADIIFFLDFNSLKRLEKLECSITSSKATKILIDHHLEPENFYDLMYSRTDVSSTAELIYHLIDLLGETELICKKAAEAFYVGIMTDTGSFSYSVKPSTFKIAAELIDIGINPISISKKVYDTYSESRIRLLGHSLVNKLTLIPDKKASYICLTKEELEQFNYQTGDTEGIVNYGLSLKGIVLTAFIMERNDIVKISLRSKGDIDVNQISRKYFNGGGHKNAAGGQLRLPVAQVVERYNQAVIEYSEQLLTTAKLFQ